MGVPDPNRGAYFIGNNNKVKKQTQPIKGDYPADITAGTNFFFVNCDIIEHQHIVGVKAHIFRVIDTERRLTNCNLQMTSATEHKSFLELQFKKTGFGHNAGNFYWNSCSIWRLRPICWNRSGWDNIKVSHVLKMQSYYSRQAVLPQFLGHKRQRGSGLGPLAAGIGRVALPCAKKVLLPAVKSIGKEFFVQSLPELMDVAMKKKVL